jgi:5-methylcytosine-specific restriction endonuclease McrA
MEPSSPDLLFPKGRTRAQDKQTKRVHRADHIRAIRLQVMQRDPACRVCHSTNGAEMHELVPRSRLRGQPPEVIYTLVNCLRLCSKCHGRVTRHEITLLPASDRLGANGRVEAQLTFRSRHVQTPTR